MKKNMWSLEKVLEDDNLRYYINSLIHEAKNRYVPIEQILNAIKTTFYFGEDVKSSQGKEEFKNKVDVFRKKYEYELVEIARNSKVSSLGKPEEFYVDNYCKIFQVFNAIYNEKVYCSSELIKEYGARFGVDELMLEKSTINEMLKGMDLLFRKILKSDEIFYGRTELKDLYYGKYKNLRKDHITCMTIIWVILNEK